MRCIRHEHIISEPIHPVHTANTTRLPSVRADWLSLPCFYREFGGRGRDRTYDQSIKSRMLYQLSYASNFFLE
jgi:hypothetical protein